MTDDPMLAAARARREQLIARMAFWERWRGSLVPLSVVLSLVGGWLLGQGVRALAPSFPEQGVWFFAVGLLALTGRALSSWFDPSKLAAAQHLAASLEARSRQRT